MEGPTGKFRGLKDVLKLTLMDFLDPPGQGVQEAADAQGMSDHDQRTKSTEHVEGEGATPRSGLRTATPFKSPKTHTPRTQLNSQIVGTESFSKWSR